jgi:hypothetical protein
VWVPQHIGLAISKTALNFTNNNVVNMIDIVGSEPADTKRRFAFKIGDKYVKLDAEGNAVNLATQAITVNSVLTEGNTAAELTALTNVPAFVGKMVYPVVALYAPYFVKSIYPYFSRFSRLFIPRLILTNKPCYKHFLT